MAVSSGTSGATGVEIRENCTAIDGLRHAQIETAHFLHLAFLAAKDHPEIAKAIRLTAVSAQTQHSLALDLIVKFSANSKHVVETLLPMILEGIDKKMPELIKEVFDEIEKVAGSMYSEANETVGRYKLLEEEVQERMAGIDKQYELMQLPADKKLAEGELKEKELVWEEYSKTLVDEQNNDGASDFFTCITFPAMTIAGAVATGLFGGLLIGAAGAAVNYWNENRKPKGKHISEYKEELRAAVHQVEKLSLAEDKAADVTSLVNASKGIGQVYDQLQRIKQFWNQLVVCIDLINKDTRAIYMYRFNSDLLREKVEYSDSNWRTFIVVCDKYVSVCKEDDFESIRKLYKFLSEPIANMTKDERRKRQADIAEKLKERIEALGNT